MSAGISKPIPRIDGRMKAEGRARYIADYPHGDMLTARFFRAPFSRGVIRSLRLPELPEGYYAVDYRDVTGANHIALIKNDWPAFAEKEIRYKGQIILILAGPDPAVVDELLGKIEVDYEARTPAVSLDQGLACIGGPIYGRDNLYADLRIKKGDPDAAFSDAERIVEGEYSTGFQEQLYMEPQGLTAWTEEQGRKVVIKGSMQCPYYVKHSVEEVLGEGFSIQVVQTTTGGAFGGKEDYPEIMGAPLAVAAVKIGKPLRMIFDRFEDLSWTSKRHPSRTRIRTAHDEAGRIIGMDYDIIIDGGAYESYSLIVLQRAIFTSNGVYNFPNVRVRGRAVATSTVPSGAFRGFGAPQAIYALEMHMEKAAREFKVDPVDYRMPYVAAKGDPTITGGRIHEDVIMDRLIDKSLEISGFREKRERYRDEPWKGIGISLFNHGCGFTGDGEQRLIKAKARLRKNADDSVDILIANIDMGQGPQTTFPKIVASILELPLEQIHYENPDTDKVPNSGPTVASRTMMIVGYLVQNAARRMKQEWIPGKVQEIEESYILPPYVHWDQESLTGDAYPAFGWGVNVVEVQVDPVSWETRVIGAWGVYDVGVAIDERVVAGQIQGGMSQVLGHACLENLDVDSDGVFRQRTMADYIVPTSLDFPRTGACTVDNPYEYGPFGAKGVGEIVHDGGHAAFCAAVEQALGRECPSVPLTPEKLLEIMSNDD
ncbi:xanthine dehydrogenase family protein molybdopterin-binding subunit [Marispirochaeta sp.]|jgi:CO/xanthine dehydrogenase Mo-binding subunit|uniref:xanthine dehydrogenase family protein molybdopterin-binding subunit n=1 Tax=Marispirochaeta sp. TaxID=2038653 RepID=UPI0029C67D1C|nr:xanthine dehydrogenase family protein molybdopterin-binding subunit [Marispirochaeta sp.]